MGVVETDAPEVDRHVLFEMPDDHLEDAAQVLPLAHRPGDPVQQIETGELSLQPRPECLALRDVGGELIQHVVERVGESAQLVIAELRSPHGIVPLLRDRERRAPERLQRPRDLLLQRAAENVCDEHRDGGHARGDQRVKGDLAVERGQIPT